MGFGDRLLGFLLVLLPPVLTATMVWAEGYSVVGPGVFISCWAVPTLVLSIPELAPGLSWTADSARRLFASIGFLIAIAVTMIPR